MDDVAALFEQVNILRWYPVIQQHTFKSEWITVHAHEASALLKQNEITRNTATAGKSLTNTEKDAITALTARLAETMKSKFVCEDDVVRAFVKLVDRSAKDQGHSLEQLTITASYNAG